MHCSVLGAYLCKGERAGCTVARQAKLQSHWGCPATPAFSALDWKTGVRPSGVDFRPFRLDKSSFCPYDLLI